MQRTFLSYTHLAPHKIEMDCYNHFSGLFLSSTPFPRNSARSISKFCPVKPRPFDDLKTAVVTECLRIAGDAECNHLNYILSLKSIKQIDPGLTDIKAVFMATFDDNLEYIIAENCSKCLETRIPMKPRLPSFAIITSNSQKSVSISF